MNIIEGLRGSLIVSCQAYPGEPMRDAVTMARVAQSVVRGGAAGIRAQGVEDIAQIRRSVEVPVIGLIKAGDAEVYITPTTADALAAARAGAQIVAIDATRRRRPGGESLPEIVRALRAKTDALILGDIGSLADAECAVEAGVDAVATTLAGYTPDRPARGGPDLDLVALVAAAVPVPVFAEGRFRTPEQARLALAAGAHAVVVGSAITHPASITSWFRAALGEPGLPRVI